MFARDHVLGLKEVESNSFYLRLPSSNPLRAWKLLATFSKRRVYDLRIYWLKFAVRLISNIAQFYTALYAVRSTTISPSLTISHRIIAFTLEVLLNAIFPPCKIRHQEPIMRTPVFRKKTIITQMTAI